MLLVNSCKEIAIGVGGTLELVPRRSPLGVLAATVNVASSAPVFFASITKVFPSLSRCTLVFASVVDMAEILPTPIFMVVSDTATYATPEVFPTVATSTRT